MGPLEKVKMVGIPVSAGGFNTTPIRGKDCTDYYDWHL